jgi:transcriptional regulator with GAF, ATPase, and Fis domain
MQVEQVAITDTTVFINGETGTGKELIARAIHDISARKNRPLVKVNCAAIPQDLIESDLFGHEKGAFTGALNQKFGRFELADAGTIFLDEIGDIPKDLQVKLLRVLQEGEFERLGNPKTMTVDVRVIAATNRNIEKMVAVGEFREDLYYRLNVFPINLPPLRSRKNDIPMLVKHFIEKYSAKIGKMIQSIPKSAMDTLQSYHWPGNVRELENIIERALVISQGNKLELGDWFSRPPSAGHRKHILSMPDLERQHILEVLNLTSWRVSGKGGAADILDLKPTTLEARMKKLGIKRA